MLGMLNRVRALQKKAEQWRSAPTLEDDPHELLATRETEHVQLETPPPTLEQYFAMRYPKYEYARHTKAVIEFLDSLEPGDFAVLNMPPRHGKSEDVSLYLEHRLGCNPEVEVMFTAFSARLATKRSRVIRNAILNNEAFGAAFPGVKLAKGSRSIQQWTLEQGGSFLCAGVGGSIVGLGAQILVFDDLVKGRKQAESPNVRDSTWDWLTADALTRLAPEAIVILIQTRWHEDDPTGRVLEALGKEDGIQGFRLRHLELRAIAEEDDVLGRQVGQPLWTRWGLDKLERNKKILGEYDFTSLYQQRPYARGGTLFHEPARYNRVGSTPAEWCAGFYPYTITITLDLAASKKRTGDHTCFQVWAHQHSSNAWGHRARVLEVRRGHWTITEILEQALDLQLRYGVMIRVEQVMSQVNVVDHLEEHGIWLERVFPSGMGDKYARAMGPAAAWNGGAIEVPHTADWDVLEYLKEHFAFTGAEGGKDDQVDTTAYNWIFGLEGIIEPTPPSAGVTTAQTTTSSFYRNSRG